SAISSAAASASSVRLAKNRRRLSAWRSYTAPKASGSSLDRTMSSTSSMSAYTRAPDPVPTRTMPLPAPSVTRPSVGRLAQMATPLEEYPRQLARTRGFTLGVPRSFTVAPDGLRVVFLRSWAGDDPVACLWVLDVATGQAKIVGNDPSMVPQRTLHPSWSPDSKWVAYASRLRSLYRAIFVANVETGETKQVTDGLADAMYPVWDASGKYLWFLASTDFGLRSQWLDMTSYDREETFGLYLAVLKKGAPSPLLPESDEDPGVQATPPPGPPGGGGGGRPGPGGRGGAEAAGEPGAGQAEQPAEGGATRPRAPVAVEIDFDGLPKRIISIPGVANGQHSSLRPGVAGTVFYLEAAAGAGGGGSVLHRYRLSERRAASFATGVAEFDVSADGRKLLYRSSGGGGGGRGGTGGGGGPALFLVDADRNPPQAGQGRLNATFRMYLEPKEEFRQIFNEGWRNQRDYLYVPNLHGTDWPAMKKMYGALLPYVMHRADLNYLLDNMGAEIAIGHSYVRGGDMPQTPSPSTGLLGADFVVEGGRYKVTRIYDNESWNPDLRAPLASPGADVSVGDFLLAINGAELHAPDNIYRLLDGTANRQTVLTVNAKPVMEGARQVTVIPVASEQGLRTRARVEHNRRHVDRQSGGKMAYEYV
ncbi:MAG: hypothetical protein EHM24_28485, partial [Acidobacteria bacterium]